VSPAEPDQGAPAEGGTPAGNNWEPAGNGWDLGNGRGADGPSPQALPVRNGNGTTATPSNGSATEPTVPGGPSRLPSFTGTGQQGPQFPLGGQNVHGSDGPSIADAADPAGVASGTAAGGPGHGDAADGQVTVPSAGPEPRLPIFDSLESDWFRRSGTTVSTAQPAQSGPQGAWTSPADEGWRAAQVVASPAAGETTQAGLPRRVPRANLVPGSVGNGIGQGSSEPEAEAPARSPDAVRSRMASFQRGVREGRAAAPQIEEP
jgi:hypothetical protein